VAESGLKAQACAAAPDSAAQGATALEAAASAGWGFRSRLWTGLAVAGMLTLHYTLAVNSLVQENPTVDEVVHLPAGVTYWQKGTFRLYHHNPPLFKLVAALPVVLANPITEPLYAKESWRSKDPSPTTFSQSFAWYNIPRYLELFRLARLVMPIFSIIGGVVVFAWSSRLNGVCGGLLSLALWVFCPNILAHARLVTSDVSSTALGVAATYAFWLFLQSPSRRRAVVAGIALGFAQLSKFSMLLLYAVWPFLWLVHLGLAVPGRDRLARVRRSLVHGPAILALSILTIDVGYFFEGVGIPLGDFEFGSRTLTRPLTTGAARPHSKNELYEAAWQFRINRFRGTWLDRLPMPLPEHYLLGFDEQKIETEGLPTRFLKAVQAKDAALRAQKVEQERLKPETAHEEKSVYRVYLNGVLRTTGGWWTYYLLALLYKIPEGTWLLVALAMVVIALTMRSRTAWADEVVLWTVPLVILFSMTFLTDINLGLRYVLAILPYLFIATGKVVPWCFHLRDPWRRLMGSWVLGSLGLTIVASIGIHPHYLAYLNWSSGGPDRVPARLIDSNLDWGQDLVALQKWCQENIPDQRIGLAYFGQINPSIFALRGEPFHWFLPPARRGSIWPMDPALSFLFEGPARHLTPGYYAVSATLLYGLPWRLYDSVKPEVAAKGLWAPSWYADAFAFSYFNEFRPIMPPIGHSIYVYHLSAADITRAAERLGGVVP
jgi:hypothetical protein